MRGLALFAVVVTFIACASSDGDSEKDTPESRCTRLCAPPKDDPCFNASTTDTTCKSTCLARLSGKSDACQSCLLPESGWTGSSCECDHAFGSFGSFSCKRCNWTTSMYTCGSNVGNSCDAPSAACDGFRMAPVGFVKCANACGETPIVDAGSD